MDYPAIFAAITGDPHYQRNLDWGEPRPGHPEGTVRGHIAELERNLEDLAQQGKVSETDTWKLKILIHTHDTFKPDAAPGVPIGDPRSHASLARTFLGHFCDDADLLAMTQLHDEPFALWQQARSKGTPNPERFRRLLDSIYDWQLVALFQIVDGCTEGKSREPLRWFFAEIAGKVDTVVGAADIL